jgi:hypothetical protein
VGAWRERHRGRPADPGQVVSDRGEPIKITTETRLCPRFPGLVLECLQKYEAEGRDEKARRMKAWWLEGSHLRPKAEHLVRIDLEDDERAAYDYPAYRPHRPRYIDLRWTWGPHRRWKLESVSLMGSDVLKSGKLGKHTAVSFIPLGPFPYAKSQDPAVLTPLYRRLVKEHAPKGIRPPRPLEVVR